MIYLNDESLWRRIAIIVSSIIGFIPTLIAFIRTKRLAKKNNEQVTFKAFAAARHSRLRNKQARKK